VWLPGVLALALILIATPVVAQPWSFAVLGDQRGKPSSATGVNDAVVQAMVSDIVNNRGVSLVLAGGDQIHGIPNAVPPPPPPDLPTMYQNWRTDMGALLNISYPVRGNHETYGEISNPYPYYWDTCISQVLTQIPQNGPSGEQGMTYSFTNQNAFFMGVDQFMPDNSDRVNQTWVNEQLSANTLPHVFVYGHLPAAATQPLSQEQSLATWPANRDDFWQSLGAAGAMVYFCGHNHLYNRATISLTNSSGTTTLSQLIIGNGGADFDPAWNEQYYPNAQPDTTVTCTWNSHLEGSWGYSVVTVADNTVTIVHYYNTNSANPALGIWLPYDTFSYTVTARTLGLNNVSQNLTPQIVDYHKGIAITKTGIGTLTLAAGDSAHSEPITVSDGRLNVRGNYASTPVTVHSDSEMALYSGSNINNVTTNGTGLLFGSGTVNGSLTNNGVVSPGFYTGPWNLNVNGSYAQTTAGSLDVEIAGASNYGRIQVSGSPGGVNLNGTVYVTLQNDYIPAANQIFPNIITASGGLTGTFLKIANPMIAPGFYWQPVYTATGFGLRAVKKDIVPPLGLLLLSSLNNLHRGIF